MTDLEVLEAAAKLGRKLERLDAEKADAHREWQERLDRRFADKRAELVRGATIAVLSKLGLSPERNP